MAFKNILVTGAYGMLGRDLVPYLIGKGYHVTGIDRDHLDLLGPEENIISYIGALQPDIIVHGAAYTDVDGAEKNPDLAMAINKDGTRKLVMAAKATDAILVYISTDFVFDGLKHAPYEAVDRPNPINAYGLSKYYGELAVTELMESYYIIRTSWLYGIHNKNFVQFVLDTAKEHRDISIVDDVFGTPTWTGSLCAAIESIMTSGAFGTYHAADSGVISRYQQAVTICRSAGLPSDHIKPVSASEYVTPATRPPYSALDCGDLAIPSWETAFHAYLEQYRQRYAL